jgi:predicted phage tail protein
MRKVHLHGHLGATFGPVHEIEVATAGEALRALGANFRNFMTVLKEGAYEVVRGDKKSGHALDVDDINEFRLGRDDADLHFIPVVAGAKRGGILKAILGVVLVGAAMFMSGGALATALPGLGGITWGNVAMIGLGLAVAGASQLLTNQEKKKEESDQSYTLSGATNTYEQGNPVPLVYGEVITGGHLISAGVDIEQLKNKAGTS